MILSADTSALVKAVLLEVGTERVRLWFDQAEQVASSVITHAEACAALGRRDRRHGLPGMDAVQSSTAMRLRANVSAHAPEAEIVFAAFDHRLLEAAEREGFATLGRVSQEHADATFPSRPDAL